MFRQRQWHASPCFLLLLLQSLVPSVCVCMTGYASVLSLFPFVIHFVELEVSHIRKSKRKMTTSGQIATVARSNMSDN